MSHNRLFLVTSAVLFAVCALGCGGFVAKQAMDSAAENTIKVMEAQAKIDKERRQESYAVEGVVRAVEMREKEVPDPDRTVTTEEVKGKTVASTTTHRVKKVRYCVVLFADGREREFATVPDRPLTPGTYYVIRYNGMNEVTGAVEAKK